MAAKIEETYLESNSMSLKDSLSFEKLDESEGRRMVFFRKVMKKCLDKIMAAGRLAANEKMISTCNLSPPWHIRLQRAIFTQTYSSHKMVRLYG